jgi:hypothetical protein
MIHSLMTKKYFIQILLVLCCCLSACTSFSNKNKTEKPEKTIFQTSSFWKPTIDVQSDVAVIYGTKEEKKDEFKARIKSWKDKGYTTHFMTGIAWGDYQDYFYGVWDGKEHLDEGQVNQKGDTLWHHKSVPYVVPTINFLKYMQERHIKPVIDAGIDAIYLEEPEYWAEAGYSTAFKREWKAYYNTEWHPQHESAAYRYLSNKLKYHLYYRALDSCFTYAKAYGEKKGIKVKCFVPTHSLINYSQWQIVSPEASLASLPCVDGYIAQVWTGTARASNYFNGVRKERVFETAFLEYGCVQSMTAPTFRKVYFLTDPIEDRGRDWVDYKRNYEATYVAQLMYPMNNHYEVMPWPTRIYEGLYQKNKMDETKERIPRFYATQIQIMINALQNMPLSRNKLSGSHGISVLMANSLMFQRSRNVVEGYEDAHMSSFYGLVFPLLKRGVPVQLMHIENVGYPASWDNIEVLLMTYDNMKPLDETMHHSIAEWVENGGCLLYASRDNDPYQSVPEWWNSLPYNYIHPSDHLFQMMGMPSLPDEGIYYYGKGKICVLRQNPKEFVLQKNADQKYLDAVTSLYQTYNGSLQFKNHFYLARGCYDLLSVLDESKESKSVVMRGRFIDLFDSMLPVIAEKEIQPGQQAFLLNLDRVDKEKVPMVLAASARVRNEKKTNGSYSFIAKSPEDTDGIIRVMLSEQPKTVKLSNKKGRVISSDKYNYQWDVLSRTLLLHFKNKPQGVKVSLTW